MDDGRDSGNVIQITGGGGPGNGADNWDDQAVWATEDEYRAWDREASVDTASNLIYDGSQSQHTSGSEPPNRKTRNVPEGDVLANSRSMAMGNMFFKTKLCCKFRAGTCPYITNCKFAHSIEELRTPPQNWKEIMAAHKEERGALAEPREEFQIPSLGSSSFMMETQRSYKGRHCKKFYTEEGCPYGDNCSFLHDEQSKGRESVAIILGPGSGGGYRDGGAIGNGGPAAAAAPPPSPAGAPPPPPVAAPPSHSTLKPSNWKTRICHKWEQIAYCPFGSKCNFAHGATELHQHGSGLVDIEANPKKQGLMPSNIVAASGSSAARADGSQQLPGIKRRPFQKWKWPNKINGIYGDWIDDDE